MATDEGAAAQDKAAALAAAEDVGNEDEAKQALEHVNAALEKNPDDADLVAAAAELTTLAGIEPAPAPATSSEPVPTPPATPGQAPLPPTEPVQAPTPPTEPVQAPTPTEPPQVVELPDRSEGWPNDWPTFRFSSRAHAKQMPEPFETVDGRQGAAGDYYVVFLDVHGDPSDYAVMDTATFAATFEVDK